MADGTQDVVLSVALVDVWRNVLLKLGSKHVPHCAKDRFAVHMADIHECPVHIKKD